jgi:SAM-dependent methyltransferase
MLSERCRYDKKPVVKLNVLQSEMKDDVERKIENSLYTFENTACCVCKNADFEVLSEKDRYGFNMPVVICKQCGLIQIYPKLSQKSYDDFYNTSYRKLYLGEGRPKNTFFETQTITGNGIIDFLEKHLNQKIINQKILEIGAGAGGILYSFKQRGNEVYGCDLDSEYLEFGRKHYNIEIEFGTFDNLKKDYKPDFIILNHVLEHTLDPLEELKRLKTICQHNTIVYIGLPGVYALQDSYDSDFLKYIHIAHVYHFTLTTLKNILNLAGFKLIYGNEDIGCICKVSGDATGGKSFINDYLNEISFLKKMEYVRYFPVRSTYKTFIEPKIVIVLKKMGLYEKVKKIVRK